ncbi:MAG: class IIb bacteriocin, lactobin A/cerein 7B family [Rubrivivax sp.]|nr:MAG: class IIb bacteriocin, lactobin A/cerein 7B family [Rubrivivax sp.]
MTNFEGLVELTDEEIAQVSGGFWAGVAAAAAWDAIKGFGSWVGEKAPGGADEGTWEQIGRSQMTA